LARSADSGSIPWSEESVGKHLDLCLGCRACEPACPSGVEYGRILELARSKSKLNLAQRLVLETVSRPWALKLAGLMPGRRIPAALSRRISGQKPEADRPRAQNPGSWPALADSSVPPVKGEVYLLAGCAMSVLFPRVHEAAVRLLSRVGFRAVLTNPICCGALHAHQGCLDSAHKKAARLWKSLAHPIPLIVDSAGCGSFLKEHSPEGRGERVKDLAEFLADAGLEAELARSPGFEATAAYHDACHLLNGQRVFEEPRKLLRAVPGLTLAELPGEAHCCGSAGLYNLFQPAMARRLLERKWSQVEKSDAKIVVTGNPGCHAWLDQASREGEGGVRVLHTAEALEASFSGLPN
jgi:glycolate oxidase iron-sulfur subunit